MTNDLSALKPLIESENNLTSEIFWKQMHPHLKHNMFALCTLDAAYNNLYARKQNKKLYQL